MFTQTKNQMSTLGNVKFAALSIVLGGFILTSCDDKDDDKPQTPEPPANENVIGVSENITSNTTWETGKTYILQNRIAVTAGNTLTIQPGTVIKGEAGSGPNATALIVARGAKIDAQGTAAQPIIFTSVADEIEPGEIAGPNLDPTLDGLWGGVIILGNAPISASNQAVQI